MSMHVRAALACPSTSYNNCNNNGIVITDLLWPWWLLCVGVLCISLLCLLHPWLRILWGRGEGPAATVEGPQGVQAIILLQCRREL